MQNRRSVLRRSDDLDSTAIAQLRLRLDRPDADRIDHLHISTGVQGADRMSEERSSKGQELDRSGVRSKQRRAQTELDEEQLHTMGTLDVEAGACRSEFEGIQHVRTLRLAGLNTVLRTLNTQRERGREVVRAASCRASSTAERQFTPRANAFAAPTGRGKPCCRCGADS